MQPIGTKIKERRKTLGMTADEVGRSVGRDRQQIYAYESDRAQPPRDVLSGLVRLGILTADEALGLDAA